LGGAERGPRTRDFRAEAMITLFVLPLILAFAPIAVWALRVGGLRRLWLLCVLALLVVVAFMLSAIYSVPTGGLLV
jgi:asparagine N-glycosylation enzyme membrane subunit Stt3